MVLVACGSLSKPCSATSLRAINPFAGLESLNIQIVIGGGLDPDHDTGPALQLFGGDLKRSEDFTSALSVALLNVLEDCQIRVATDGEDELLVSLYGRTLRSQGQDENYVALVKLTLIDNSLGECSCSESLAPFAFRTFLSHGLDRQAERSLISQITVILAEATGCRPSSAMTREEKQVPSCS